MKPDCNLLVCYGMAVLTYWPTKYRQRILGAFTAVHTNMGNAFHDGLRATRVISDFRLK